MGGGSMLFLTGRRKAPKLVARHSSCFQTRKSRRSTRRRYSFAWNDGSVGFVLVLCDLYRNPRVSPPSGQTAMAFGRSTQLTGREMRNVGSQTDGTVRTRAIQAVQAF